MTDGPRGRVLFQDPALFRQGMHRLYPSEKENRFGMMVRGLFYCSRTKARKKP